MFFRLKRVYWPCKIYDKTLFGVILYFKLSYILIRKSKIAKLFDWTSYQAAQDALLQSPNEKSNIKAASQEEKTLRAFQSAVTKDIKLGLKLLLENVKKGQEATVPYFLHLDYFTKGKEGSGSLLILGTQPAIRKAFVATGKMAEKVNLSYGTAELDANNILRFIPEKNGMKVKPKPLVDTLKQAPISKSNPGFWSKRKVNNVIIGAPEENSADLTGNSDLVEEEVTYTEKGVNSEVYDAFKSFVNKDYVNSNGTRNAEYYAQALAQVDNWLGNLQEEFKSKRDKGLKGAYKTMGKKMLLFKKQVQQEIKSDKAQHINGNSSLPSIKQLFERTVKEHGASKDAYQRSILVAKLNRILLKLEQKINGDESQTEALLLQAELETALAHLDARTTIEPAIQQQIDDLMANITELFKQHQESFVA